MKKKKSALMKHTRDVVGANLTLGVGNVAVGAISGGSIPGAGMLGVVSTAGYAKIAMDKASKIGRKKK